jgi:membrane-bound lytic murein transglycosylase D
LFVLLRSERVTNPFGMKKAALSVTLLALLTLNVEAQQVNHSETLVSDDPVLAMLDSLEAAMYFEASSFTADTQRLNVLKLHRDSVPKFSDEHFRSKLASLDVKTPFRLVYNDAVRKYIDAYTMRHKEKVAVMMGLAELYFPLFEETLDRYNLPLEFKYLAVVESALNPKARSKSGAMGLWQFMYRTGKIYDLNTTSYLDDRCDPFKATEAACQYFQYLYAMFGNWELVLAAYNGGPGTLNKAIRRSGGKRDYWELRPYLPVETQGYVPAFIAVNYVMKHANLHNIYPVTPEFFGYEVDTVVIKHRADLQAIARVVGMPYEQVEFLNPIFRTSVVPASEHGLSIIVPKKKIGVLMANLSSLQEISDEKPPLAQVDIEDTIAPERQDRQTHRIRGGETLSSIASRYRCSVSEICEWNGIKGNMIREGQTLVVYTSPASAAASAQNKIQDRPTTTTTGRKVHVVQQGDTLWQIAKENGLTLQELKELNGLGSKHSLKIGEKLKIG